MNQKFKVYHQVRISRQAAGDIAEAISVKYDGTTEDNEKAAERAAWQTIESLLMTVESRLEMVGLW